jgi:hypothetical protein
MTVADYLYILFCLTLYFHIFDFKISADAGPRFSISEILSEFPIEAIHIHLLEIKWAILKACLVAVPILLLDSGMGERIAGFSGYVGLCILLGPATLAGESLRYIPRAKDLTLREKATDYVERWFKTRPGEKLNVLFLSGAVAAVIAVLKSIFPKLSIMGFIVRGPWIPMLNGEIHPGFLGDTLMFLTLFALVLKGTMAGRIALHASWSGKLGFLVCSFFAGFNTISFIVSYTALASLSVAHFGTTSLLASVGAIALRH